MSTELKKMKVACDDCKTYDDKNSNHYFCVIPGSCPGVAKTKSEKDFLYNKKYRKTIEGPIGATITRPGRLRGKLVETIINDKECIGRFLVKDSKFIFLHRDGDFVEVDIRDVSYVAEYKE